MESIWNKKSWQLPWLSCSMGYIIACWCVGKFRDKCIKIYELDPAHFLSAPGLAWQACLKKTEVKLELLTDIDMLLMFEEGTRGVISQAYMNVLKQTMNIWIIMIKTS